MSFGEPLGLLSLVALAPLAAAWALARRRTARADRAVGPNAAMRRGRAQTRRLAGGALLALALIAAAGGVARPQWGNREAPLERRGIDIVIALDISRSMGATDVAPSRAAVAASGLDALLERLRGDRVGLVTFGGTAFRRSPLTLDLDALGQLVRGAQTEGALVGPGTSLGAAVRAALETLDVPEPADTSVIVLVSDGEDLAGEGRAAAQEAAALGVRLFTVPVGTAAGGSLPAPADGAAGDTGEAAGSDPPSRTDREALRALAARTGGELREVETLPGLAVEFSRLRLSDFDRAEGRVPLERSSWCFGAAALLAALGLALPGLGRREPTPMPVDKGSARASKRRPHLARVAASGGLLALLLLAACSGDQTYRANRDGNAAYRSGAFEEALRHYHAALDADPLNAEVTYNIGHALHQLGRYDEAIAASARAADLATDSALANDALYATGNHEFARGNLPGARDAYITVLLRDPGHREAKHNLELTLRALLPPPEPPDPPPPAPPDGPAEEGDGPSGPPEPGEDDGSGPAEPPPDGEDRPPDPGAGDDTGGEPQPGGEPDAADGGTGGGGGEPRTLAEAEAALQEALATLAGRAPTEQEALDLLDLLRLTSGLRALPDPGGGPGDR